jgi:hypothetical protein
MVPEVAEDLTELVAVGSAKAAAALAKAPLMVVAESNGAVKVSFKGCSSSFLSSDPVDALMPPHVETIILLGSSM